MMPFGHWPLQDCSVGPQRPQLPPPPPPIVKTTPILDGPTRGENKRDVTGSVNVRFGAIENRVPSMLVLYHVLFVTVRMTQFVEILEWKRRLAKMLAFANGTSRLILKVVKLLKQKINTLHISTWATVVTLKLISWVNREVHWKEHLQSYSGRFSWLI